ncbi:MAG: terminase TerL endonuclease subunit [Acidobacteriota bacterium]|jgi:phage terminase large subunit-like protein
MITGEQLQHWKADPVAFVREVLRDPETGQPFELYEAEERFLREALTLTPDGRLPFPELVFGAPKKSGKTGLAAIALAYIMVVLGGRFAEGYCLANDLDQSTGRVFQALCRIIEASLLLRDTVLVYTTKIVFPSTGATVQALASDYAGAAGSNPTISVFDELWAYTSERSHRLWDEMVPPPTRKVACRLTVTYAGFEGESDLLEKLYKRGLKGEQIAPDLYRQPGMLMYWTHECRAPWQTEEWKQQMREQLRPNAYLRMIENRWVTTESIFVDMAWWDACVYQEHSMIPTDTSLPVHVGVDASTKRDLTAIVGVTYDHELKKVILIFHKIFQPTKNDPLDFEATIEETLLDLSHRFRLQSIRYDPWQMVAVAQRLQRAGLQMTEFPQSVPNLTEASNNLYELIKSHNLVAYPDEQIRLAISRAVAVETSRGWRITKEKASHKIDVVVALAQACLGAVTNPGFVRAADDPGYSFV